MKETQVHERGLYDLERQLSRLAARWRGEHSIEQYEQATRTVQAYHAVMTLLLEHDWLPNLDPDEELPEELMPAAYEKAWALRLYEQKVVDLRQTLKKLHISGRRLLPERTMPEEGELSLLDYAYEIEQAFVDAGAVPDHDYTYRDLIALAVQMACTERRIRAQRKIRY